MGARFRVVDDGMSPDYALDIRQDRHGQYFQLYVPPHFSHSLEATVLNTQPRDRHLVLLVKKPTEKARFLCGHDEREWFVAAVPGNATTVVQAKEALKPRAIRFAEMRAGLRVRDRFRRHNPVSIRQGEWFFVPMPNLRVDPSLIRQREPIRRGSGKPHYIAELYRAGGEPVYVCSQRPQGLNEYQYRLLLERNSKAKSWAWTIMRRNAGVFARGTVRHPDHATIVLPGWHQVLMNTENETATMRNVAFLD